VIDLWCDYCQGIHAFELRDVERLIYAMQLAGSEMIADPATAEEWQAEARRKERHGVLRGFFCLREMYRDLTDQEMFGEYVLSLVEARQKAQDRTPGPLAKKKIAPCFRCGYPLSEENERKMVMICDDCQDRTERRDAS